ncbi:MAG: ribosome small subunit-dependent GTPase A [Pseudomonadota bacterium]
MTTDSDDLHSNAIVCAAYGRRVELELPDETTVPARTRRRSLRPVCGDRVVAVPQPGERDWLINAIEVRSSELARTDTRGRRELLAANVNTLVVVVAPAPPTDWFMVDRFLGGAHLAGIDPLLVVNKNDLLDAIPDEVAVYDALGYERYVTDAHSGEGIAALAERLAGQTAALVGQSGVGKSSLTNALVPAANLAIGALTRTGDEGRHTTVAARRLRLPRGGALIDSPGVRDYAPHVENLARVAVAFPEVVEFAAHCRFANCHHRREPDCAVRAAVAAGDIDERRYTSYRRLYSITASLQPRDGPRRKTD